MFSSFRFSPVRFAMDSLLAIMQSTRVTTSALVAVSLYKTSFKTACTHDGVFLAFEALISLTLDALVRNAFWYCILVEPSLTCPNVYWSLVIRSSLTEGLTYSRILGTTLAVSLGTR